MSKKPTIDYKARFERLREAILVFKGMEDWKELEQTGHYSGQTARGIIAALDPKPASAKRKGKS